MKLRRLDDIRCPWCGEIYKKKSDETEQLKEDNLYCEKCGKYGKQNEKKWEKVLLVIVWIYFISGLFFFFRPAKYLGVGVIVVVSIAMLRLIETGMPKKAPVYRFDKNGDKIVNLEQYICMAEIHWYSSKKNGILFHNFRIWSNMIFPVCFVDKKDTPISQVVCVRLVKEHFYRWKRVTVYQITDVLRQEQVKEGQKFYIFNARERIGEGVVTDKRG